MIKTYLIFPYSLFIILFVSGCSTIEAGFESLAQSFSESEEVEAPLVEPETNTAMLSTRVILKSQTEAKLEKESTIHVVTKKTFNDVWQRIPSLYQISDINNHQIKTQLKWYKKHKYYFERISKRATPFLYLITDEVEKRQIPGEIALLPIIESAFKTDAYSRRKAAGLWQFMPATGRYFGLKQTWWYDGRRDVFMATDAALTYLTQLNKYYHGDWLLALAAYNAGAGNVDKAIKKNKKKGRPTDYWSLDLPKETRRYIPKLLAIAKLVQDSEKHQLNLHPIDNTAYLQLVNIQSQIDLSVLARVSGLNMSELKTYNPAFKQWATDPNGPHHILLPIEKVDRFENKLALLSKSERIKTHRHKIRSGESLSVIARHYHISINSLKQANQLKSSRIRAGKYLLIPTSNSTISTYSSNKKQLISYKVKKGDSLYRISRQFNVSIKSLKKWNKINNRNLLKPGQKLKVFQNTI